MVMGSVDHGEMIAWSRPSSRKPDDLRTAHPFCNFSALVRHFVPFRAICYTMKHALRVGFGRAHNPKVEGSNPSPATKSINGLPSGRPFSFVVGVAPW